MPHYTKQDHLQLLARARAVLKSPADCDAKDIRALIEDLYAAEDRLVTEEVPWSIEVHVGTIDHNQGTNGYAALSRAALLAKMASFCRAWWKEAKSDLPDELTAALGLARERGCHGVIFDRDASEVAMLEIFDW